jgi:hypothetical protein
LRLTVKKSNKISVVKKILMTAGVLVVLLILATLLLATYYREDDDRAISWTGLAATLTMHGITSQYEDRDENGIERPNGERSSESSGRDTPRDASTGGGSSGSSGSASGRSGAEISMSGGNGSDTGNPNAGKTPIYCHEGPHPVTHEEPTYSTVQVVVCSCGLRFATMSEWDAHKKSLGTSGNTGHTATIKNEQGELVWKTVVDCAERKIIGYK